jgi:hypothetical protein
MRLDEIVDYKIDGKDEQVYKVYYAHKYTADAAGYLNFRQVRGGSYPIEWTIEEVEEHARKDWARAPHYGTFTKQWDDQNYVFVVVVEHTVFKQWHELPHQWTEEVNNE